MLFRSRPAAAPPARPVVIVRPTAEPSPPAAGPRRRAWLGVALQPIRVPPSLVQRAGQDSGRMVMNVTPGGPADAAGLRAGDVLLALDGQSTSGSHSLRAILEEDRAGQQVPVRFLREGTVHNAMLTVGAQPG